MQIYFQSFFSFPKRVGRRLAESGNKPRYMTGGPKLNAFCEDWQKRMTWLDSLSDEEKEWIFANPAVSGVMPGMVLSSRRVPPRLLKRIMYSGTQSEQLSIVCNGWIETKIVSHFANTSPYKMVRKIAFDVLNDRAEVKSA